MIIFPGFRARLFLVFVHEMIFSIVKSTYIFPGFRVRLFLVSDLLRLFRNCDDRPDVPDALQLLVHLAAAHGHRLAILTTLFLDLKDLFLILIFFSCITYNC